MEAHDRIVLTEPQLHGNIANVLSGEVVSIRGSEATVAIDGEVVPRIVPLDQIKTISDAMGVSSRDPRAKQIIDAIRR